MFGFQARQRGRGAVPSSGRPVCGLPGGLAPGLGVRDLARIPGDGFGAGLPKLLRAVVLRPCEGTRRDAPVKQQPGRPATRRTRPAARGAGHRRKPAHMSSRQRPRRLASRHILQ